MPNPNERNQAAVTKAVKRLHAAVAALWKAGASWEEIEDEIENAQNEVGVDARVTEK